METEDIGRDAQQGEERHSLEEKSDSSEQTKKGKDVKSFLRRQAIWKDLTPMCRYEQILKSVGK